MRGFAFVTRSVAACGALALVACSPAAETPGFDTRMSTKEVMAHVINPAAVAAWGRAGTVEDEHGVVDLAPDTEDEWTSAENEAAVVAEGGNLLLLPDRVRKLATDDGDWSVFAGNLTDRALALKASTEARNKDKMFEDGGRLYEVCVACHEKYYVPFLKEDETTAAPRRND